MTISLLTIITHHWYDVRDLSNLSGAILDRISDADAPSWVVYVVSGLLGAVGILSFIGGAAIINIWIERRFVETHETTEHSAAFPSPCGSGLGQAGGAGQATGHVVIDLGDRLLVERARCVAVDDVAFVNYV